MRVTDVRTLHCDAGWRNFSFLKITTDTGVVGWSEYTESYGNRGLTGVIRCLADYLVGKDPRPVEAISAEYQGRTRQAAGSLLQQAIGAIENALLDVKAKSLGIPVYEMLGGPIRTTLPLYWSHCGSYRLSHAALLGVEPPRTYDDIVKLGHQVTNLGFVGLKCNIIDFDNSPDRMVMPGFYASPGGPELNVGRRTLTLLQNQLEAFREGAGDDAELFLDVNFNYKTEGYIRIGRALEYAKLGWLELDSYSPEALSYIRKSVPMPIASGESLHHRRQYRPFLEQQALDVAIVDILWNGMLESLKIASMADVCEVNVAPHNYYGHLASIIAAHFCAIVPNFRIMEMDVDDVAWKDDLVTEVPEVSDGELKLPSGPGWGVDVNEAVVYEHPARDDSGLGRH